MRLIDADEFQTKHVNTGEDDYEIGFDDGVQMMLDEIKDAKTIDAEPVVRCKDCQFFSTNHYDDYGFKFDEWCNLAGIPMTKESFCSNGELKKDKQDEDVVL